VCDAAGQTAEPLHFLSMQILILQRAVIGNIHGKVGDPYQGYYSGGGKGGLGVGVSGGARYARGLQSSGYQLHFGDAGARRQLGDGEGGFGDIGGLEGLGEGFGGGLHGPVFENFRIDEAGADHAGADVVLLFFHANGVGQTEESALGGLVGGAGHVWG
jgi:hypothetical protein